MNQVPILFRRLWPSVSLWTGTKRWCVGGSGCGLNFPYLFSTKAVPGWFRASGLSWNQFFLFWLGKLVPGWHHLFTSLERKAAMSGSWGQDYHDQWQQCKCHFLKAVYTRCIRKRKRGSKHFHNWCKVEAAVARGGDSLSPCLVTLLRSPEQIRELNYRATRTNPVFKHVQQEMATTGYNRTIKQISKKLKKLKKEYWDQKRDPGRSGNSQPWRNLHCCSRFCSRQQTGTPDDWGPWLCNSLGDCQR